MFQSSSSPKAGCYLLASALISAHLPFQSSSSPKAGCYAQQRRSRLCQHVSILIQPEGWMLLEGWCKMIWYIRFNPHPARRLDAIRFHDGVRHHHHVSILIQPEGWMLYYKAITLPIATCFNPHPARRLDAISRLSTSSDALWFQSSSSPKAGCYTYLYDSCSFAAAVSILIQPEGWMLC